ncbi:MAG: hypothetical protein WD851_03310 [Pirellulales bacterium]
MTLSIRDYSTLAVVALTFCLANFAGCGSEDALPAEQAAAVKALEAANAKVSVRDGNAIYVDFYGMPDPAAAVVHLKSLPNLEKLNFSSTNVTDDELTHLADLSNLRELALNRTRVTDQGLAHLAGLKNLEVLNLSEDAVTDAGLVHLKNLRQIEQLHLNETKVSDAGLMHLAGLKQLLWLFAYGTDVTGDGAATFREQHPGAEVVVTEAAGDAEVTPGTN